MDVEPLLLALDLPERANALDVDLVRSQAALAQRRLRFWLERPPFDDPKFLARWLRSRALSEDELLRLLGESLESLSARIPEFPDWARLARRISEGPDPTGNCSLTSPFRRVAYPFIGYAQSELGAACRELFVEGNPVNGVPLAVFTDQLGERLLSMAERALVLELNIAREQGLLRGTTPEERFAYFVRRFDDRAGVVDLLRQYPVLWRQLATSTHRWVEATAELLLRLSCDRVEIRRRLANGEDMGPLVRLTDSLGDRHDGQRSVALLEFASGLSVMYKPRSLAVDAHFQELLTWLNQSGIERPLRVVQVLDRGDWGWTECIRPRCCTSRSEIVDFYWRLGALLGILYLLNGVDCHYENLLAEGPHPVLVDVETLFHGTLYRNSDPSLQSDVDTVMRVSLLPQHAVVRGQTIDVSAIGGDPSEIRIPVPCWDRVGRDDMRITTIRGRFQAAKNRPILAESRIEPAEYVSSVESGFDETCRLMMTLREELLRPGGRLSLFDDDEVRAILRPTRTYAHLLYQSQHPDVLGNALYRTWLFGQLWCGATEWPNAESMIEAEYDDLAEGDVPRFAGTPTTRTVRTRRGRVLDQMLAETGMSVVRRRLLRIDDKDVSRQRSYIRTCLTALSPQDGHASSSLDRWNTTASERQATSDELLDAAAAIGSRIDTLAFWVEDEVNWLGLRYGPERWSLGPVGIDLYGGLPGIALFLAYLGRATGERLFKDLARAALANALRLVSEPSIGTLSAGAFEGLPGLVYVLPHLASQLNEPELLRHGEALYRKCSSLVFQDESFDVMCGAAGCVLALLAFLSRAPSREIASLATAAGDHLLSSAMRSNENGYSWKTLPKVAPLGGFSHGVAGIALALERLARETGGEQYHRAALEALRYQEYLFDPQSNTWRDLRLDCVEKEPEQLTQAWCHGAPGIGLALLEFARNGAAELHMVRAHNALETTLRNGFGGSHCLCHGDLGNLDLLIEGSRALHEPELLLKARSVAGRLLALAKEDGWRSGVSHRAETPGLMAGLSGIGYQLLRLADPDAVPSVLTLEPPRSDRQH